MSVTDKDEPAVAYVGKESLSTVSPSTAEPQIQSRPSPTFPDGGFQAWAQVGGLFVVFFNSWGLLNAFGTYQDFYQKEYLPEESASRIAWIGSLQSFLMLFGSVFAGPLMDLGYLRVLVWSSSLLSTLGMMLASISTKYWQLMLTQGLLVGIAQGLVMAPCCAVVVTYFAKKRSLALGLGFCGAGVGGVVYAIIINEMLPRLGFGWTTRVVAFIILGTQIIPSVCIRQRIQPAAARRLLDTSALRDPSVLLYGAVLLFAFAGLYVPFFYIQTEALYEGTVTGDLNFYLLAILNSGSFFGRVFLSYLADKTGPLDTLIPSAIATTILAFCWLAVSSSGGIIAFCVLYGFISGAFVSLNPSVIALLTPDMSLLGTRTGMFAIPAAIGSLVGNPIAGAATQHGFQNLKIFCGSVLAIATAVLVVLRVGRPSGKG